VFPPDSSAESGAGEGLRRSGRRSAGWAWWVAALISTGRSVGLRVRVAIKRDFLDRALAEGANPGTGPELALRAAQLVRERDRRALGCCLRLLIREAEGAPWLARVNPRQIQRGEILADRQALVLLIERLESPRPAGAEGAAIAERLFTDLHSPLFDWAEPGTIRRLARRAVAAMDASDECCASTASGSAARAGGPAG